MGNNKFFYQRNDFSIAYKGSKQKLVLDRRCWDERVTDIAEAVDSCCTTGGAVLTDTSDA